MEFDRLIQLLERAFRSPLPGKSAHMNMSPIPVDMRRFETVLQSDHRKSGVLILFYPDKKGPYFPLIKRPEYVGFHSGQVAFPGGKMELGDKDIVQTALREAEEEIGVDRSQVQVLGRLSDLYIPTSNFLVSPVIGFLEKRPDFIPEVKEVARVIQTELPLLFSPEIKKRKVLALGPNLNLDTPYFEIDGEVVWGATAMILSELIHILQPAEG